RIRLERQPMGCLLLVQADPRQHRSGAAMTAPDNKSPVSAADAGYPAEITAQANDHPLLGAEYFAARDAAERFLSHWHDEHVEHLAEEIMKPVLDVVKERVWDAFRDWLLIDTEYNIQGSMSRMVEISVKALIGGEKWANIKYISP